MLFSLFSRFAFDAAAAAAAATPLNAATSRVDLSEEAVEDEDEDEDEDDDL